MVDPATIAAVGGTIANVAGDLIGGGPTQTFGDTNREAAQKELDAGFKEANTFGITPTSVGGVETTTGGTKSKKQTKQENLPSAAIDFLMESRGLSKEEATAEIAKVRDKKGSTLKDIPGFQKWLKSADPTTGQRRQDSYGLKVKDGKIQGTQQTVATTVGGEAAKAGEDIASGVRDYNQEQLDAAKGLPSKFAEEAAKGIDIRDQMRQKQGILTNVDENALTPEDKVFMDNFKQNGIADLMKYTKDLGQQVFSSFNNTGFLKSNLFADTFADRVVGESNKAFSRFADQLYQTQDDLLTNRQGRRNSQFANITNAIGSSGPTSYNPNLMSPDQAGEFGTKSGAEFGANQANSNRDFAANKGKAKAEVELQPDRYYSPSGS